MLPMCALMHAGMEHIDGIVIQPLRKLSTVFFDSIIVINIKKTVCRIIPYTHERVCVFSRFGREADQTEATKSLLSASTRCSSMVNINVRKLLPFFDVRFCSLSRNCYTHSHMHFVPVE